MNELITALGKEKNRCIKGRLVELETTLTLTHTRLLRSILLIVGPFSRSTARARATLEVIPILFSLFPSFHTLAWDIFLLETCSSCRL